MTDDTTADSLYTVEVTETIYDRERGIDKLQRGPRRIEYTSIDELTPANANPKRHAGEVIEASMDRFGYTEPILVDERTNKIVAGHGRLEALKQLREEGAEPPEGVGEDWTVPVMRGWASANDDEANAYLVASNRLTELGGWDNTELLSLLDSLDDLDGVGYTLDEIQEIANKTVELPPTPATDPDAVPSAPKTPVTKKGDLWILGSHRILCGDCRDYGDVERLMDGAPINVAFTSPPYADARKYDASSGFKPIHPDEYVEWFAEVQANVRAFIAADGSWFVNIKATADDLDTPLYVFDLVVSHVREWGWHFATEFCWERTGMPKQVTRRFKNQFEPVYQFAVGEWKMRPKAVMHQSSAAIAPQGAGVGATTWSDDMEQRGFDASRVGEGMAYPGNRLPPFSTGTTGHTAAFPVALPAWFIRAYSDMGDNIYDPFMGSGSTLIGAHNENRNAYGTELSPAYVDVICRRFQEHTGIQPVLEATGEAYDFTEADSSKGFTDA